MAIHTSTEIVQDMKHTLQLTVSEIQRVQENLEGAMRVTAGWEDAQGAEYHKLMKKIAQLTNSPKETLAWEIQKLEKLEHILDKYQNVHF